MCVLIITFIFHFGVHRLYFVSFVNGYHLRNTDDIVISTTTRSALCNFQGMTSPQLVGPMIGGIKELYESGDETLQRDAEYIMTAMAAEVDLTGDYTETFLEQFIAGKMPNLMSTTTLASLIS